MLHQEPVVAAVRGQADRQQLVVFPPEPRYLQEESNTKKQHGKRMRDICLTRFVTRPLLIAVNIGRERIVNEMINSGITEGNEINGSQNAWNGKIV